MSKGTVGFIGLGNIGKPMAARLLQQGFDVISCAHARRESIDVLKTLGLTEVATPRDVAAAAEVVMTVVRDIPETEAVVWGTQGVMAGLRRGSTLVLMSTLDPHFCRQLASQAAEQGIVVLDSPVSGGPMGAQEGTLALMVGGDAAVIDRWRSCLETLGRITHCGEIGMGTVAKLANNAILFGSLGLVAEALALGRAYGMPSERLIEVFKLSSANNFPVQHWGWYQEEWDHLLGLGMKDVQACLELSHAQDVQMPLTAAARHYHWDAYRP